MATVSSSLQFVGEQPDIIGQVCSGFVVQHFCEETTLVDQANATFLRFSGIWYRICFETGTVFWRSGQTPAPAVNSTLQHGLLLNDLSDHHSIQGRTLSGIDYLETTPVTLRSPSASKVKLLSHCFIVPPQTARGLTPDKQKQRVR